MAAQPITPIVVDTTGLDAPSLRVIVCVVFKRNAPPDQLAALKKAVIECPSVLNAVEAIGTFDFLMDLTVPDIATFNERLNFVAASVASLVERYEVNFVSKRFTRRNSRERAIWVSCENGMARIDHSEIDKVIAEGDYMRIHSNGRSWMLHATMRSMVERLDCKDFIQIHRSALVRADFVDRLVHESGHWVACLNDGSLQPVAKRHVVNARNRLRTH